MNQSFETLLREIMEERASTMGRLNVKALTVDAAISCVKQALNASESVIFQP